MSKYLDTEIINREKKGFGNDFDLELNKEYAVNKLRKLVENKKIVLARIILTKRKLLKS